LKKHENAPIYEDGEMQKCKNGENNLIIFNGNSYMQRLDSKINCDGEMKRCRSGKRI
jgi:hypothetical protein